MAMQAETGEPEVIERVAALDIGKAEVVCCARVPARAGSACRRSARSPR
jgi:transposase